MLLFNSTLPNFRGAERLEGFFFELVVTVMSVCIFHGYFISPTVRK